MSRIPMMALFAAGCAVTQPFEGPMYTLGDGLTDTEHDTYVVAVTHIRIRSGVSDLFDAHVSDIEDALTDQPGLVGYALRAAIPGRDRWTMSVWTDEQALTDFVMSQVHAAAMADAGSLAEEAGHTHFTAPAADIPVPWDQALAELDQVTP